MDYRRSLLQPVAPNKLICGRPRRRSIGDKFLRRVNMDMSEPCDRLTVQMSRTEQPPRPKLT